ncbi:hypothetical protein HMN09_00656800 [Mycena chlorophos]|uniref:Uncharacterized protein n=1 Tax=Mycena chlorophos TaxID=658473 RepID=A0A8H6T6I8_MYCCL|nr:hypothetical protein HMN09_00656800 [Mycena chlorophos]
MSTVHTCPLCQSVVPERVAGPKSKYPGATYIRCGQPSHAPVVHFIWLHIPAATLNAALAANSASGPSPAPTPPTFTFSQPPAVFVPAGSQATAKPKKSSYRPQGGVQLCAFDGPCTNNRIATNCSNNMCKCHCGEPRCSDPAADGPRPCFGPSSFPAALATPNKPQPIPTVDLTADSPLRPTPTTTPRKRVSAPSKRPPARPIKHVITKQLNDSWVNKNGPAYAAPPLDTTSLLHVRKSNGRRPFDNTAVSHRFVLLFLTGAEKPPVFSINFSSLPTLEWPNYRLSEDARTLSMLGDGDRNAVQFWVARMGLWMEMSLDETHTVHTDGVLVLRWRGARGPNDQVTMDKLLKPDESQLRHNLVNERKATANMLRIDDSDPESEPAPSKRVGSTSPPGTARKKRPRLVSNSSSSDSSSSPPMSALSLTTTSMLPSAATTPAPSPTLSTVSLPASLPTSRHPARRRRGTQWPHGWHVVDLQAGLLRMDSVDCARIKVEHAFMQVFGTTFARTSFYRVSNTLRNAPMDLKAKSCSFCPESAMS